MHTVDLPVPVPAELVGDFRNKLHYVSERLDAFALSDDRLRVEFRLAAGHAGEAATVAGRIAEVARKMCAGHRDVPPTVLATRRPASYPYPENPRAALEADDELYEYGRGRFGLGPRFVRLLEYFDAGLLRMADGFGAARRQFPALVGADVLHRCRYIQSFPHSLTLTAHLREDLDAIARFAKETALDGKGLRVAADSLAAPECLLSPTVCFHCYAWLSGRTLDQPQTVTAMGKCFRYESGAMATLERLWDFTMREIVFVGPQDFALERRQQCIDGTKQLLDEWELGYEIKTATDPFFIEGYSAQTAFQTAFELKFEIRADLPYEAGKSLAIGSFNFHQDFFGRAMSIALPDGKPAHTACVGFGMERLAWAFLSQHGPDPARWPVRLRTAVGA